MILLKIKIMLNIFAGPTSTSFREYMNYRLRLFVIMFYLVKIRIDVPPALYTLQFIFLQVTRSN